MLKVIVFILLALVVPPFYAQDPMLFFGWTENIPFVSDVAAAFLSLPGSFQVSFIFAVFLVLAFIARMKLAKKA